MKNFFKSTFVLMMSLFMATSAWADEPAEGGHVTTERVWSFTNGKNHAGEVTDCEYWKAGSKGRYSVEKDLTDCELPSNKGGGADRP